MTEPDYEKYIADIFEEEILGKNYEKRGVRMTPQEAIEQIDRMIEFENKCRPNSKRIEALEMAKQALVHDESNYENL